MTTIEEIVEDNLDKIEINLESLLFNIRKVKKGEMDLLTFNRTLDNANKYIDESIENIMTIK